MKLEKLETHHRLLLGFILLAAAALSAAMASGIVWGTVGILYTIAIVALIYGVGFLVSTAD